MLEIPLDCSFMRKYLSFILLIIPCLLGVYWLNPHSKEPTGGEKPLANIKTDPHGAKMKSSITPKEYMIQPLMSTFTEKGQLKHILAAEHWEYKPEANLSALTAPQTTIFKPHPFLPDKTSQEKANTNTVAKDTAQTFADTPITIQSDSAEFDDKKGIAIYYNHVILTQGTRCLYADTLTIQRNTSGHIEHMIAIGKPAHFQARAHPDKPIMMGHAETIHYFPIEEKVLFIENAELSQQGNVIRSPYLNYLLKSEILSSESRCGERTLVIIPKIPKGQHP